MASRYCGASQRLLYAIVAAREIRSYKIHKKIVIAIEDLDEYIKQNVQEVVDWDAKAGELRKAIDRLFAENEFKETG